MECTQGDYDEDEESRDETLSTIVDKISSLMLSLLLQLHMRLSRSPALFPSPTPSHRLEFMLFVISTVFKKFSCYLCEGLVMTVRVIRHVFSAIANMLQNIFTIFTTTIEAWWGGERGERATSSMSQPPLSSTPPYQIYWKGFFIFYNRKMSLKQIHIYLGMKQHNTSPPPALLIRCGTKNNWL